MKSPVAGVFVIVFGLFFGFLGLRVAVSSSATDTAAIAYAEIVDFETEIVKRNHGFGRHRTTTSYEVDVPIYEFVDRKGFTHRVKGHASIHSQNFKLGDITTIAYDPRSPERGYVIGSGSGSSSGLRLIEAGLLCAVPVGIGAFMLRKKSTSV